MALPSIPLVVLDTETTGFVPRTHEIIEYASVLCEGGTVTDTYESLFTTEEIPPTVEILTRIRTEDVQGKRRFVDSIEEIRATIPENALIVGQNILFDLGMLKGAGLDLTERPWIDTSMLASIVFPELESYSLGYLSTVLKLDHSPKHRALGDVRATLELLEKCCDRLAEITPKMHAELLECFGKSTPGLKLFAQSLPKPEGKRAPSWLSLQKRRPNVHAAPVETETLRAPAPPEIGVREEPLDPSFLVSLVEAAAKDKERRDWFLVKNLDASVRRFAQAIGSGKERIRIIYAPFQLLDPEGKKRLSAAETFLPDEATVALKLAWYEPRTRNDFPLHGGEEAVWNGKLACTSDSKAYRDQWNDLPHIVLIDQRQFLRLLAEEDHPAKEALREPSHVLIDDASMLEDTATKACGWTCNVDHLRAASQGHPLLARFTDLLQLWIEKVRTDQDLRYLAPSDLSSPEAKGLREQLAILEGDTTLPSQALQQLQHVARILDADNLASRIAWIEKRQDGGQVLQSVPEHVSDFLASALYAKIPTTLLVPPGSGGELHEIIPDAAKVRLSALTDDPCTVPIGCPIASVDSILAAPEGKTILLLSGRGAIENAYVKHVIALEEKGVTMVCQGVSGGSGRMRAEFLAAPAPAFWLITPWSFEGLELPPDSVDHLVLASLPFDYLSHPVLSKRAARYRDSFGGYFFPRLQQRLFRIVRTFCRFKTAAGDVRLLDDRLRAKEYGKRIIASLSRFSPPADSPAAPATPATTAKPKATKKSKAKGTPGTAPQLPLF